MTLTIAAKPRPFCHVATRVLIPYSDLSLYCYPTRLEIEYWYEKWSPVMVLDLNLSGPIQKFTVVQDLEKGCIWVFGQAGEGYFRYRVQIEEKTCTFFVERCPPNGLIWTKAQSHSSFALNCPSERGVLQAKEKLVLSGPFTTCQRKNSLKLSFGVHKAQDWLKIKARAQLEEILPLWLKLAHTLPASTCDLGSTGVFGLLSECKEAIEDKKIEEALKILRMIFQTGFEGLLVPRTGDDDYQGVCSHLSDDDRKRSPLILLQKGGELISSLFVRTQGNGLSLLPHLPSPFHCGRLLGVETQGLALINLEWTKRQLKQVVIKAMKSGPLKLFFPPKILSGRLKVGLTMQRIDLRGGILDIEEGQTYQLDCFDS